MAVTADKPAPYAPTRTVLEVVNRHRSRGLTPPINGELLGRIGVTDSLIARTLQALTVLDLIDDQGAPTPTFQALHLASEAEYPARMADWLNAAYADIVALIDPATATDTEISDAFRPFNPRGQRDRMVILFKGLYTAAGVRAPDAREIKPRPAPGTRAAVPRPARAAITIAKIKAKTKHQADTDTQFAGLPPMLAALLRDLPANGQGWTQERRDKVVKMFPTVMDFAFPIIEEAEEAADEE